MSSAMHIHRQLREKLASLHNYSDPQTNEGNDGAEDHSNRNPKQSVLPIQTVQSLLSRDPHQLASDLHLPIDEALVLRARASRDLMATNLVGRQSSDIVSTVSLFLEEIRSRESHGKTGRESSAVSGVDEDESLLRFRRPAPLFLGAVTVLDHCIYQSYHHIQRSRKRRRVDPHTGEISATIPSTLSTGSVSLDTLISTPKEMREGKVCSMIDVSRVVSPNSNRSSDVINTRPVRTVADLVVDMNPGDGSVLKSIQQLDGDVGLEFGIVTEAVGASSSGKTQLALTLACQAAAGGISVHYLASGGNASVVSLARRVSRIVSSYCEAYQLKHEIAACLERVNFTSAPDGYALLATLAKLENHANIGGQEERVLVIFDSVSGCLTPNLLGSGANFDKGAGVGIISEVCMALRRHARLTGNAVFVTNGIVSSSKPSYSGPWDGSLQPALGGDWRAADVRIFLKVTDDGSSGQPVIKKVSASLDRHYSRACNSKNLSVSFGVSATGVVDL